MLFYNNTTAQWIIARDTHACRAFARCTDNRVIPDRSTPWEVYRSELTDNNWVAEEVCVVKVGP